MRGIRSDAAEATESNRGTLEIANNSEADALTADDLAMTPEKTLRGIRSSNAQATSSNRGTAAVANESEAETGTNSEKMMTPERTKESVDHNAVTSTSREIRVIQKITQDDYDALSSEDANTLYVIVG